jgi:hypothetical protein
MRVRDLADGRIAVRDQPQHLGEHCDGHVEPTVLGRHGQGQQSRLLEGPHLLVRQDPVRVTSTGSLGERP